jgi:uncharacterized protein YndB with AHSA1/START domain
MFKKILIALAVVIAAFLVYAATRPDSYSVERSALIAAPAPVVFDQLDDFKSWSAWSPWDKLDPSMQKTFDGPASGVGASYAWQGNKDVGKGKMTIVDSRPPHAITYRLEFIEPFTAEAQSAFEVAPQGDAAARVRWQMTGTNNFMSKVFGVFMDMDSAIGKDFEKGLASLKEQAETEAKRAAEADAGAQAARLKTEAEANAVAADTAPGAAPAPTPADPSPAAQPVAGQKQP